MLGVFSAGRINPVAAPSHFIGGMTMGIGMALHEHGVMDPRFGARSALSARQRDRQCRPPRDGRPRAEPSADPGRAPVLSLTAVASELFADRVPQKRFLNQTTPLPAKGSAFDGARSTLPAERLIFTSLPPRLPDRLLTHHPPSTPPRLHRY
jgi:hypothetical protein